MYPLFKGRENQEKMIGKTFVSNPSIGPRRWGFTLHDIK